MMAPLGSALPTPHPSPGSMGGIFPGAFSCGVPDQMMQQGVPLGPQMSPMGLQNNMGAQMQYDQFGNRVQMQPNMQGNMGQYANGPSQL